MYPVSIIICHYNQKKYLIDLLNYLKENNWALSNEVIVVDDYSLSNIDFKNLKKLFKEITFVQHNSNRGPSASRNTGLKLAKGEYVQFLDADDWISPEKIKIQYTEAVLNNHPTFISSTWSRVDYKDVPQKFSIISIHRPIFYKPISFSLIRADNFIPLMSALILRERILSVGSFDENMWLLEDIDLSIRLSQKYDDFYNIDSSKPLFFYRSNNNCSLSESNKKKFNQNNLKNYLLVKNILGSDFTKNDVIQNIWLIYFNAILTKDKETLDLAIKEINQIKPLKFDNSIKLSISSLIGFKTFAFLYPVLAKIRRQLFFLVGKNLL